MMLLLCGQQRTQPLSLPAAKFSMPSASLWSKTSQVIYSNETGFSSDMHHVHLLQHSNRCWK